MLTARVIRCLAVILTITLLALAAGCITIKGTIGSGPAVTGSGTLETREMDYSGFTTIEAGYAFQVDVTKASSFSVSITLNDNLYEYLDIRKTGDTLYLGLKPNHSYRNITHRATITMPQLRGVELTGVARADISGFSSADSLRLEVSGAGFLDLDDIEAGDVTLKLSGASRASGSIKMADGDFDLSGASSVDLKGTARDVSMHISGASSAKLADFAVVNADVELSGASSATVNASERLDANLSGLSRLRYVGNPTLGTISTSGGSTIKQR